MTLKPLAALPIAPSRRTRYGSLIAWAKELGRDDCASDLQKNPEEEKSRRSQAVSDGRIRVNAAAAAV